LKLRWKPPADDGGSKIINYIVEMKEYKLRKSWSYIETIESETLFVRINNLEKGARYSFRIIAENKYGRSDPAEIPDPIECNYKFNVPNPPMNCVAKNITKNSCNISFREPEYDGGSPIIGYIVERRQLLTSRWLKCNKKLIIEQNYFCDDLIEGTEYEFRVIAENLAGQSDPSEPCKSFLAKNPFDTPGPPIDLKTGKITNSSIELVWDPPIDDGGSPIFEYKIEIRNSLTVNWQLIETFNPIINNQFIIDKGIKEGCSYEFRVFAINKAGNGPPSMPSEIIEAKEPIIGEKPILIEPMKDIEVLVGDDARLVAKIKCNPKPNIKWFLNDSILDLKDDITSTFKNDMIELKIKNVQIEDSGEYKFLVKNPLGQLSTKANLVVLKKPIIKYDKNLDKAIELIAIQQNLHINCEISGFPRPIIKWYHKNHELNSEESRGNFKYGENFATIHLNKIKRNEGGEYKLIAENKVGKSEAIFIVKVLDIPLPPENLDVSEISSFSCKLTWKKPKDDGNTPVTGYFVEKSDSKNSSYTRIDKTTLNEYIIAKLVKGESYKFRIIAENKIGLSEPCEMNEYILAKSKFDVPGAPGVPDITDIDKNSCKVTWNPPKKDGGKNIIGYFIERKSGSKWIRISKDPIPNTSFMIKDLMEGSAYVFRICAFNEEGEGPFSRNSESIITKNRFEKPDPPIDVEVNSITKSGCLLTWRPPKRNGGLPIVKYHVEMKTKNEYKFYRFTDDFISECEYEIKDLIENQDYEFRIIAENKQGESLPSEPTRKIKIRERINGNPPEIDDMPAHGNLIGSLGKIQVRVIGDPIPSIKWKKGTRNLKLDSSKYSFSYAESLAVLYIRNLTEEDHGNYSIEAENVLGSDSKNCKFFVYEPPKILFDNKYKKQSILTVGSNLRISCQVNGCPTPEISWIKDDLKVKKCDKMLIDNPTENQYFLTVKQCDRTDSGNYYIRAINAYGKDEAKFEVKIVDVPDKPNGPLEILLDAKEARIASLNWKPPYWDGGSDLTGYTIEYAKIIDPAFSKSNNISVITIYFFKRL
jgi:titin